MNSIPLESASLIVDKALQKGRELKFAPLTMAVLDAGGVLIKNREGQVTGSVWISGDTSDNDEICAVHEVEAAGLIADTGRKD